MTDNVPVTTTEQNVGKESNTSNSAVEPNANGEKKYSESDLQAILSHRIGREVKKLRKEFQSTTPQTPNKAEKEPTTVLEKELRDRVNKFEAEIKTRDEVITKFKTETMRSSLEKTISKYDAIDPESVANDLLFRGVVKYEDDKIVAENIDGNVETLVKEYLTSKPHLVKPKGNTGAGSRNSGVVSGSTRREDMTLEEKMTEYGVKSRQTRQSFGDVLKEQKAKKLI
jgi:hypothetical protein